MTTALSNTSAAPPFTFALDVADPAEPYIFILDEEPSNLLKLLPWNSRRTPPVSAVELFPYTRPEGEHVLPIFISPDEEINIEAAVPLILALEASPFTYPDPLYDVIVPDYIVVVTFPWTSAFEEPAFTYPAP